MITKNIAERFKENRDSWDADLTIDEVYEWLKVQPENNIVYSIMYTGGLTGEKQTYLGEVDLIGSRWISVEDRLPEIEEKIFIYIPKYDWVELGCLEEKMTWEYHPERPSLEFKEVTHWQPLPSKPSTK